MDYALLSHFGVVGFVAVFPISDFDIAQALAPLMHVLFRLLLPQLVG